MKQNEIQRPEPFWPEELNALHDGSWRRYFPDGLPGGKEGYYPF